jgi:hypothetical protein
VFGPKLQLISLSERLQQLFRAGAEKVRVCGGKGLRLVRAARSEGRAMEEELHVTK